MSEQESCSSMTFLHSSLRCALVFVMLSCVLSRGLCQVVTEVSRRSYPTYAPILRAFTTSSPKSGEQTNNGKQIFAGILESAFTARGPETLWTLLKLPCAIMFFIIVVKLLFKVSFGCL